MILGIDIDNTISDTHEMIAAYAQRYGAEENRPLYLDRRHYFLNAYLGWPEEVVEAFRQRYLLDIYRDVAIKVGAAPVLRSWHRRHRIILITGRNSEFPGMEGVTRDWLERQGIPYDRLIMNDTPHMHHFSKNGTAREAGIELMVEDHPDLCLELAAFIPVLMFDQPYNRHISAPAITRVFNWAQIAAAVT